jgi:3,4-dihydroxy-2-butanone 4-phosphate synthase
MAWMLNHVHCVVCDCVSAGDGQYFRLSSLADVASAVKEMLYVWVDAVHVQMRVKCYKASMTYKQCR